ncbi:unnamed protein product [Prunus armeniaca]|uniref:Uncharacterized protein n=1 Tax=Prunus armeniaca TaxID=36596 RepID=A0A6J5WUB7_PRUAR|nr:unnamed protein product [Prunus armeniaca]
MEEDKASTQSGFVFTKQEDKLLLKLSMWPTTKHFFNPYMQKRRQKVKDMAINKRKKEEKKLKIMSVGYHVKPQEGKKQYVSSFDDAAGSL